MLDGTQRSRADAQPDRALERVRDERDLDEVRQTRARLAVSSGYPLNGLPGQLAAA